MIISVASLCLRFYRTQGWTKSKIRKLLVNPKMEITYRNDYNKKLKDLLGDLSYYAVYGIAPNKTDYKIFKKSEIDKHTFDDRGNFGGSDWYINKEK